MKIDWNLILCFLLALLQTVSILHYHKTYHLNTMTVESGSMFNAYNCPGSIIWHNSIKSLFRDELKEVSDKDLYVPFGTVTILSTTCKAYCASVWYLQVSSTTISFSECGQSRSMSCQCSQCQWSPGLSSTEECCHCTWAVGQLVTVFVIISGYCAISNCLMVRWSTFI